MSDDKLMRQYILMIILVIISSFSAVSAQTRDSIVVTDKVKCTSNLTYFRFAKSVVDSGYMNNAVSLRELDRILTDKNRISKIDSIVITASGSPEGVVEYNQTLAARRAKSMKEYICWKYPHINQQKIFTHSIGEDWAGLRRLVEADSNAPHKEQILKVLAQDVNPSTKKWRLKQIDGGKTWNYITNHHLRYLRAATTCVVFYKRQELEKPVESPVKKVIEVEKRTVEEKIPPIVEPIVKQPAILQQTETIKKPLFALKTNLLLDLAMTPNIELEVPIGKRWSINAEFQRGWWLRSDDTFCWQIESGSLEGRYWFGSRDERRVLTGWFAGVFASGGFYDFQLKRDEGYQGEFYILAGLSGGYATPIARNLNLEFSLGVGYIVTDYRHYHVIDNELIKQGTAMRFSSLFPAKAKISLVWVINRTVKRGGGR